METNIFLPSSEKNFCLFDADATMEVSARSARAYVLRALSFSESGDPPLGGLRWSSRDGFFFFAFCYFLLTPRVERIPESRCLVMVDARLAVFGPVRCGSVLKLFEPL